MAQFWASLTGLSAAARATKIQSFYFNGLLGFAPVIRWSHYSGSELGSGQLRTNQFMPTRTYLSGAPLGQHWQLREYALAKPCIGSACQLRANLSTVKENPAGTLFAGSDAQSTAFQTNFVEDDVARLLGGVNEIAMTTPLLFDSGQSYAALRMNDPPSLSNDYTAQSASNATLQASIATKLLALGSTLSATNVTDRATTQSCGGCHQISNGKDLGNSVIWPSSNGFTHIDEDKTISQALSTEFLPHRKSVLETFLCDAAALPRTAAGTLGGSRIE